MKHITNFGEAMAKTYLSLIKGKSSVLRELTWFGRFAVLFMLLLIVFFLLSFLWNH